MQVPFCIRVFRIFFTGRRTTVFFETKARITRWCTVPERILDVSEALISLFGTLNHYMFSFIKLFAKHYKMPIKILCMLFDEHRMKWMAVMLAALVLVTLAMAEGEIWEEDDHEVLIRSERGAKKRGEILVQLGAFTVHVVKAKGPSA
jgi:hypothetical protein